MQKYDDQSHIPNLSSTVVARVFVKSQSSMSYCRINIQARSAGRRVGVSCVLWKKGLEKLSCKRGKAEISQGCGAISWLTGFVSCRCVGESDVPCKLLKKMND